MMGLSDAVAEFAVVLVGAWALPALGMRWLVPSLESSSWFVSNYRGRRVFLGLGIVWVFWALGLALGSLLLSGADLLGGWIAYSLPAFLVLMTFVFGLVDDVWGSGADKGFGGHLRALVHGRLTTGGLKLIGIGAAALWAACSLLLPRSAAEGWPTPETALGIVAATVLISGCANLLNLLDLRPGRALKGYIALFAISFVAALAAGSWATSSVTTGLRMLGLAVLYVGPALAIWRYDVGERGMLGDAGANPAGALVGLALAASLGFWGIVVAALIVAALNLSSERVSFSQVIGGNRFLRWLDGLGRLHQEPKSPELIP